MKSMILILTTLAAASAWAADEPYFCEVQCSFMFIKPEQLEDYRAGRGLILSFDQLDYKRITATGETPKVAFSGFKRLCDRIGRKMAREKTFKVAAIDRRLDTTEANPETGKKDPATPANSCYELQE